MRTALRKINGIRSTFYATFGRYGTKSGWTKQERTLMLKDVRNEKGEVVADHLWFNLTKGFANIDLSEGDQVKFEARVTPYRKGYQGWREVLDHPVLWDYKLSYPTKLEKIEVCHAPLYDE